MTATVNSSTSTKGAGQIDRTEDIKLSVAAVVTDVLPNGNLMISGSQEVRVNAKCASLNDRRHRPAPRHQPQQHDLL